jgi:hypothetical protein
MQAIEEMIGNTACSNNAVRACDICSANACMR